MTDHPDRARDAAGAATYDLTIDARGLRCPTPVIELAKRIGEVPVGGLVAVLADDEAARHDVPACTTAFVECAYAVRLALFQRL